MIQTFFSHDIKEEIQIKGRTARKDNAGSYEILLCRQHLTDIEDESLVNMYNDLCTIREETSTHNDDNIARKIAESRNKHDRTMKLLKSFCSYNPKNRNNYFAEYPFVDLD